VRVRQEREPSHPPGFNVGIILRERRPERANTATMLTGRFTLPPCQHRARNQGTATLQPGPLTAPTTPHVSHR
jgi:hypothetical protein